ncbi:MAG: DNA internalization-related competence protein ComEC/Rec2 [Rhodocyclales bacterium CG_4_9_14_3_um_filter_68_10]|nr:MAG: DNA internalization-related competence protein ComEC/Rec2 [Rhodocyclales bacterium CG_4_9_14_3_um_filter_68_10]
MRILILALATGIWIVQLLPALPAQESVGAATLAGTVVLLLAAVLRARAGGVPRAALLALAGLCLGLAWAGLRAQERLADALPEGNEGRDLRIVGVIAGLPQEFERGLRFEFEVEAAEARVPERLSLAWYRGWREEQWHALRGVHAGSRWALTVRLKRPHGNANPHGFDYEAWLFERNLRATGYVRTRPDNRRIETFVARPGLAIERMREVVRERFRQALPEAEYAGVLIALALGDQRAIDPDLWQVFRRTGTTHLMSISGLHVTMLGALVYVLVGFVWRRVPCLALAVPAQQAAAVGGWLGAAAYALLSGFGVPAQRTLYMLSVVAAALLMRRSLAASRVLALALALVLLIDPWAVTSAGFWLSFGAVSALFFIGAGRIAPRHWLAQWGAAQWAVTVGLLPALLALFGQFSLISPLANALAIPIVSFIVAPLALAAAVLPFDVLLLVDHAVLSALMAALEWMAGLPIAMWQQAAPPPWAVALGLAGCAVLLLPRGVPARATGIVLLLPLATVSPPRPAEGEAAVTVLDVGHGLAVHVQTRSHDLVYDTGPAYSRDANSGNRVIVPYLDAIGVRRLGALIISHRDNDHSGGAAAVLESIPADWFLSSLPADDPLRAATPRNFVCTAGSRWNWNGVAFEVLHPAAEDYGRPRPRTNAMSCVLRIEAAGASVLLSADIEARSETELLARGAQRLRADVLVAPHHGSRSSSTAQFLDAVGARTVVIPLGYRNRFHHPHPEVLRRYLDRAERVLRTDRDGAVTLRLGAAGMRIETARGKHRRYWHGS